MVPVVGHENVVEANNSYEAWLFENRVGPSTVLVALLPGGACDCPNRPHRIDNSDAVIAVVGDGDGPIGEH